MTIDNIPFEVDLENGIVPVTKASSELTSILRRSKEKNQPILLTANGYPAGVIMDISLFTQMRDLARQICDVPIQANQDLSEK